MSYYNLLSTRYNNNIIAIAWYLGSMLLSSTRVYRYLQYLLEVGRYCNTCIAILQYCNTCTCMLPVHVYPGSSSRYLHGYGYGHNKKKIPRSVMSVQYIYMYRYCNIGNMAYCNIPTTIPTGSYWVGTRVPTLECIDNTYVHVYTRVGIDIAIACYRYWILYAILSQAINTSSPFPMAIFAIQYR